MSAAYPYHHAPPPPGVRQPGEGQPKATAQAGGFVTVNDRLYAPLQGLQPGNVLMGGYDWLDWTDGGVTPHPGLDLNSGTSCNSDEGLLCVAPLAGVVRAALWWDGYTSGEGNHVWIELDDPCCPAPTYLHNDHLQTILVSVGQRLTPGQPYGRCGRSGNWDCAHAHVELSKGAPVHGWWQWPYGWSIPQVEQVYYNPYSWWSAATALVIEEGGEPIPPETITMLEDWQVRGWILAPLYEAAGIPYNPDSGTAQAWVSRLREGYYPGRPRSVEQPYGEGDQEGVWVEFEGGVCLYRLGDGQVSWTG